MKKKQYPDKKAFKRVCQELAGGGKGDAPTPPKPLTLEMVGDVFGPEFLVMLVYCLMDSQDAARAVAGAINRLKAGE